MATGQVKTKWTQPVRELWYWLRSQFVQPVPDEVSLCEFDCQKLQCTMGEWETCDRRISKAAGELMPISRNKLTP